MNRSLFVCISIFFLFYLYVIPVGAIASSTQSLSRPLSYGMKDPEVVVLQTYLINTGLLQARATGYFGNATRTAVRQFQTQHNLPVVGIVGPLTRNIINTRLRSDMYATLSTRDTEEQSSAMKDLTISAPSVVQQDREVTTDDIQTVTGILNDIASGYTTHAVDLILKHTTDETTRIIQNKQIIFPTLHTFTVQSVFSWGGHIVAESTTQTISGASDIVVLVFVRVNSVWEFDVSATLAYMESKKHPQKSAGDIHGFVDLAIVDAVVSPQRPIVNSPETRVVVTIKNKGTKTSYGGAPLVATLEGFQSMTPIQSGVYYPLTPGESAVWTFYPYKNNTLYQVNDIAGVKTVRVTLNNYRDVVESNYYNNVFTKVIEVYNN